MLAILVTDEFEAAVNALLPEYLRLGSREIVNGEHAGYRLVNTAIINSTPEWTSMFNLFMSGGTAVTENGLIVEDGKTVEFTGPTGKWEFEIKEFSNQEILDMFPEQEEK